MSIHRDRIRAILKGEMPDRVPISLWRHFYEKESTAESLADAMIDFQKKYDWDFMKVNPRASYHIEGWGAKVEFNHGSSRKTKVVEYPIKKAEDWKKIEALTFSNKALEEQLRALSLIKKEFKGEIFLVETIFTPLSIAGDLVPKEKDLVRGLKENPQIIHSVLEIITDIFTDFAVECLNAGADGIFLATTEWATKDLLTEKEYLEFGKPYDLKVLRKIGSAEFNILHVCKSNNLLSLFTDYPVKVVNWNATDSTNLSLKEGAKLLNKVVLGGIDNENLLLNGKPDEVSKEIKKIIERNQKVRFMLGSGCTISPETPEENLKAARKAVEVQ
jgi:uroporphyrinogen decarboxylase